MTKEIQMTNTVKRRCDPFATKSLLILASKFVIPSSLGVSSFVIDPADTNHYHAVGFRPLEEFKKLWGEVNPCLFMVKVL